MRTFKDSEGKEWTVQVTGWEMKQVYDELDIYLTAYMDNDFELAKKLASEDGILLLSVLWVILREQISEAGLDEKAFAQRIFGDPLRHASIELARAIADFFRDPVERRAVHIFIDKCLEMETVLNEEGMSRIKQMEQMDVNSLARNYIAATSNGRRSRAKTRTKEPSAKSV